MGSSESWAGGQVGIGLRNKSPQTSFSFTWMRSISFNSSHFSTGTKRRSPLNSSVIPPRSTASSLVVASIADDRSHSLSLPKAPHHRPRDSSSHANSSSEVSDISAGIPDGEAISQELGGNFMYECDSMELDDEAAGPTRARSSVSSCSWHCFIIQEPLETCLTPLIHE